jgi:divalent anion:Na+ symporter, DASS family
VIQSVSAEPSSAIGEEPPAPKQHSTLEPASVIRLAIPVAVGLAIWFLPVPEGVKPDAWHLLAIFVATIVGVIAKPLPMGAVTVMGIVATILTGILEPADALSGFSNPTIWLIVMAFFISRGVIKTGLGSRVALFFVSRLGSRVIGVSYALALTDLILAPATPSNTARAGGIIMPIVRSISATYGSEPNSPSSRRVG